MLSYMPSPAARRPLLAVASAIIMILALTAIFLLRDYHEILMRERQEKTRRTVENAYSLLSYYENKAERGDLSPEKAKFYALETMRQILPEQNGYFWVIDTGTRGVMHPFKTDWVGADLNRYVGPDGRHLFMEVVSLAQAKGEGYVRYPWSKPDKKDGAFYDKISYVKLYAPWGWIIGTGIYMEDIEASFWNAIMVACGFTIAMILFLMVLTLTISESLKRNESQA